MTDNRWTVGPAVGAGSLGAPADRYVGTDVTLERMDADRHAPSLYAALKDQPEIWTYMLDEPSTSEHDLIAMLKGRTTYEKGSANVDLEGRPTLYLYAIVPGENNSTGHDPRQTLGYLALFRLDYAHRTGEIGHVMLSPKLQRTRGATEAHALLMTAAFHDVGVRRLEWKCNELNAPSKRSALRLGYTFEGVFRKHYIVKGHSRDTAWYSITDDEWPQVEAGLQAWLSPSNFDATGQQVASLDALRQKAGKTAEVKG